LKPYISDRYSCVCRTNLVRRDADNNRIDFTGTETGIVRIDITPAVTPIVTPDRVGPNRFAVSCECTDSSLGKSSDSLRVYALVTHLQGSVNPLSMR
jgi:hypothetical protein